MKKTQIDSLYAISFSLLYIFMEQFFFPTDVAIVQCFIIYNVKSNTTDLIHTWFYQ